MGQASWLRCLLGSLAILQQWDTSLTAGKSEEHLLGGSAGGFSLYQMSNSPRCGKLGKNAFMSALIKAATVTAKEVFLSGLLQSSA